MASQAAIVVKNPPANAGRHKRCRFDPWIGKIAWRKVNVYEHHDRKNRQGYWNAI